METRTETFECELSKPNQKVTWLRDGVELDVADTHYKISTAECTYSLTVVNCTLDDTAEYTLRVDDVSTSATLLVEGKTNSVLKPQPQACLGISPPPPSENPGYAPESSLTTVMMVTKGVYNYNSKDDNNSNIITFTIVIQRKYLDFDKYTLYKYTNE